MSPTRRRSSACRALAILCAAAGPARLAELKRAAVGAEWELVGGAVSLDELAGEIERWDPDVVLIDASLGEEAAVVAAGLAPGRRVVVVGEGGGPLSRDEVRAAVLGLPRRGP